MRTQLANLGPTPSEQWSKQGGLTIDLTKLFRTGITAHPFVDLNYQSQNFVGKDSTDPVFGGLGIAPSSSGRIGFDLALPLLRGRGSDSVAAGETAAGYDLEASRLTALFQKSQSVLATVQAYWQARAAAGQVDVLRRSVEIEGELSAITRSMIAANEKPRSDEARVQAATADARSRYEAAQRQLNDARIALAQAMGVALADALSIPLASDPYPQPPAGLQVDPGGLRSVHQGRRRQTVRPAGGVEIGVFGQSAGRRRAHRHAAAPRRHRLGVGHQRPRGWHRLRQMGIQKRKPGGQSGKAAREQHGARSPRLAAGLAASDGD